MTLIAERPANATPPTDQRLGRAAIDPLRMVVFPARVFLALGWIRAGIEKLIDPRWWDGAALRDFLASGTDARLPFLGAVDGLTGSRSAMVVALIVLVAELAIGACLVTARRLPQALTTACTLNIAFVALGAVNPSAFYLVLQLTLLLSIYLRQPERRIRAEAIVVAACVATTFMVVPFIRTIEPHAVIEDPAMMLATLAMLVATTVTIIAVDARSSES